MLSSTVKAITMSAGLAAASVSLMHAAAEDAAAGRLDPGDAAGLITATLLAAFTPHQGE
jgi:hypothetical protein